VRYAERVRGLIRMLRAPGQMYMWELVRRKRSQSFILLYISVADPGNPVARHVLNRKNAFFAGHDDGAANWASVASLIETCKLHAVDPRDYVAEFLTRLVNRWPNDRIDEILTWAWAALHQKLKRAA